MKILIISYYYSPDENPRVYRWNSLLSHWISCGHDVSVITASQNRYMRNKGNPSHIIRVSENIIGKIGYQLKLKNISSELPVSKKLKILRYCSEVLIKCIKGFYSFTVKKLQWPDFAWPWILNARRRALQFLKDNSDTDIVISVSHPFSSHLIGYAVKKKYPKIRWVMDLGDPFCFLSESQPNNFNIYNRLNKNIERKFFSQSNFISVTTKETKVEYSKLFPENKAKIKVIPPLINSEAKNIVNIKPKKSQLNNKKLRLLYIGTLYSGIRHPKKMLDMLDDVRTLLNIDFEIHFYGLVNDVDISNMNRSYIYFHGGVSHKEALQLMMQADILINIGNSTKFQFPSKLVEYVSTGKPLLNVISNVDDSSLDFLSNYPISKTICMSDENKNTIVNEVADYIKFTSTRRGILCHIDTSKYDVQNIANQYESMFF